MIPNDWVRCKLGKLAKVKTGGTPKRMEPHYWGGDIPWMSSGEIHKRYINGTKEFITEDGLKSSNACLLPQGTVMIALNGQGRTRGTVAILRTPVTCNQSLAGFITHNNILNANYLFFYLDSKYQSLRDLSGDHGRNGLNLKLLREIEIYLPPLPEQKKIAATLSSVEDAIQATQAIIDQTRTVKQGLMQQLLTRGIGHTRFKQTEIGEIPETWESIPLGDFGNFTNGINKGKEDFGFGIPFVNLQDVFGVNRISSLPKGLVNATQQEIQRYSLKAGDVLFVRSSVKPSGVGLTAVITDNIDDVVFSGFLIRYRQSKSKLIAKYLEHCFYEPGFRRRLLTRSSVSANTNINQKALEQLLVAIPSEVEQKQISSVLDSVDCAINQEQQKVAALTKIKRGLMQDLLTGRMRVKLSEEATT